MWKTLRAAFDRLRRWAQRSRREQRTLTARERFWTEVRAGEREAEASGRP